MRIWHRLHRVVSCGLFLSVLACGLCVRPTHAAETLTLQGALPRIGFTDDFGTLQSWQLTASSGGFDVRDLTVNPATVPFRLGLGLPNDALRVTKDNANDANVGINGVASGFNHLHIRGLGSCSIRLETTQVGLEQAWQIATNHDFFSIQDVGGISVPFRIDAGAPFDTLVLDGTGRVGIGTNSPDANSRLDIRSSLLNGLLMKRADANAHFLRVENSVSAFRCGVQGNGDTQFGALTAGKGLNLLAGGAGKVAINASGQINFGNIPPAFTTDALKHQTGARLTAAGVWTDASSRTFKQDIEPITSEQARDTVRALQPVGYRYKNELDERYVGFIAEDVPELVATSDRKSLAPMDIVAVLTKVVQDQDRRDVEQQQTIDQQQQTIARQQELLAALTKRLTVLEERVAGDADLAR